MCPDCLSREANGPPMPRAKPPPGTADVLVGKPMVHP
jgi:hypothetical protein